jgi:Na+(H+)/acetate symporter ActP
MDTNLDLLILILPYAFVLHNLEELISMEKWSKSIPKSIHPPVTTAQFSVAITLFTLLGFVVVLSKDYYPSEEIYILFVSGFAGMLFLNTFFPHLIATIYLRKYAPGVITGLLINTPLTAIILWLIYDNQLISNLQITLSVLIGGFTGATLAFFFLKIGNLLTTRKWN